MIFSTLGQYKIEASALVHARDLYYLLS